MPRTISQRELRNDNAEIMRQVERRKLRGDRNGKPIADLVPHGEPPKKRKTGRDMQEEFREFPRLTWSMYRDREEADRIFGDDRIEY